MMTAASDAADRLHRAAVSIAAHVDVADRLANDPDYPADRGPRADALRAESLRVSLTEYRAARDALHEACLS